MIILAIVMMMVIMIMNYDVDDESDNDNSECIREWEWTIRAREHTHRDYRHAHSHTPVLSIDNSNEWIHGSSLLGAAVSELDQITLAHSIQHIIFIAVIEEGTVQLVVQLATAIGLSLGDNFSTVLSDEFIFFHTFANETAESLDVWYWCYIWR